MVENAFGTLSNLVPEKVEAITMACCALHNFLRANTDVYMPPGSVDKEDLLLSLEIGIKDHNQQDLYL